LKEFTSTPTKGWSLFLSSKAAHPGGFFHFKFLSRAPPHEPYTQTLGSIPGDPTDGRALKAAHYGVMPLDGNFFNREIFSCGSHTRAREEFSPRTSATLRRCDASPAANVF
jgi:hypothetical protein